MDHEHGRLPRLHELRGIGALVAFRILVVRAAVVPFREPQLFSRVVHRAVVEEPGVVHEAAEGVRPVARDPVDHVAAVGAAERAGAAAVEPGIPFGGGSQALLEILERLAAPVAADRVGECLAIAGRAVEIDEQDAIARAGEHLRIPAIAPGIRHARLRPAVDDERDRIARAGLPVPGLQRVAVDLVAARAVEGELLGLAEPHLRQPRGIDLRQRARRRATVDQVQVRGRGQALQCATRCGCPRHRTPRRSRVRSACAA